MRLFFAVFYLWVEYVSENYTSKHKINYYIEVEILSSWIEFVLRFFLFGSSIDIVRTKRQISKCYPTITIRMLLYLDMNGEWQKNLTEYYYYMIYSMYPVCVAIEKNHTCGTCDIRMEIKMTMNQIERILVLLDQKREKRSEANCGSMWKLIKEIATKHFLYFFIFSISRYLQDEGKVLLFFTRKFVCFK